MLNKYNLYNDMENQEYGRYRDTVSDWTSERDYLANAYNNERTHDRSIYDADKNFAYGTWSDDRNYNYQVGRDAVADAQWQATFDEGVRQYNETMAYNKSKASSGGGGGNTTPKSIDVDDYHTIMYEASSYEDDNALANYLMGVVGAEILTTEQAQKIYNQYRKGNGTLDNPTNKKTSEQKKAEDRYYNMKAKQADRM